MHIKFLKLKNKSRDYLQDKFVPVHRPSSFNAMFGSSSFNAMFGCEVLINFNPIRPK